LVVSKQLLPVFDKPMIYHPLTTLMLSGIREILVISTPSDLPAFRKLLSDGAAWGVNFSYAAQERPEGIAQALTIAKDFLGDSPSALILGDNIFYGHEMTDFLKKSMGREEGATVFAYRVNDPWRYGVAEFDSEGNVLGIEEKPAKPRSSYAVTGLYFYDSKAPELAATLKPSKRGELEISDLNGLYLARGELRVRVMGRGFAWLDTGTHENLLDAGQFISTIEKRQGMKIACPEEVAFRNGWITREELEALAVPLRQNAYGAYLLNLAGE
jgi:glucose-1-phosphate thymidylyltransferase